MNLAGTAHMIAAPDKGRSPVATMKRFVVLHGRRGAANVKVRFLVLWTPQKAVAHLDGPVLIRHEPETHRSRIPLVNVEIVTVFVRFTAIEDRSFKFEPAISKPTREYAKRDVS